MCAWETLEEGTKGVHGTLSPHGVLLVGGRLLDLLEYAIASQATEADRVLEEGGEGVGGVNGSVRRLGRHDAADKGADVLLRGRGGGAGLVDDDSRSHGRRLRVRHLRKKPAVPVCCAGCEIRDEGFLFWRGSLSIGITLFAAAEA